MYLFIELFNKLTNWPLALYTILVKTFGAFLSFFCTQMLMKLDFLGIKLKVIELSLQWCLVHFDSFLIKGVGAYVS